MWNNYNYMCNRRTYVPFNSVPLLVDVDTKYGDHTNIIAYVGLQTKSDSSDLLFSLRQALRNILTGSILNNLLGAGTLATIAETVTSELLAVIILAHYNDYVVIERGDFEEIQFKNTAEANSSTASRTQQHFVLTAPYSGEFAGKVCGARGALRNAKFMSAAGAGGYPATNAIDYYQTPSSITSYSFKVTDWWGLKIKMADNAYDVAYAKGKACSTFWKIWEKIFDLIYTHVWGMFTKERLYAQNLIPVQKESFTDTTQEELTSKNDDNTTSAGNVDRSVKFNPFNTSGQRLDDNTSDISSGSTTSKSAGSQTRKLTQNKSDNIGLIQHLKDYIRKSNEFELLMKDIDKLFIPAQVINDMVDYGLLYPGEGVEDGSLNKELVKGDLT